MIIKLPLGNKIQIIVLEYIHENVFIYWSFDLYTVYKFHLTEYLDSVYSLFHVGIFWIFGSHASSFFYLWGNCFTATCNPRGIQKKKTNGIKQSRI